MTRPIDADADMWTVGRLRDALARLPADLPVVLCAADETYTPCAAPTYPSADWGDGSGIDTTYVEIDTEYFSTADHERNTLPDNVRRLRPRT